MRKRILIPAGVMLLAFVLIAAEYDGLQPLNRAVRDFVGTHLNRPFYYAAISLHYLFENLLGTVQTLIWGAVILFVYKSRSGALLFVAAMLAQSVAVNILKSVIGVQRPPQEYFGVFYSNLSYPSGHACVSAAMAIMLAWIIYFRLKRREGLTIGAVYCVLALLTAYSRMYLDVHWFLDVIGGLLLGGFISLVFIAFSRYFETFERRKA